MMLGCDACPGGIPGIGPKRAFEIHKEFNAKSCQSVQQLHEDLATLISKTARALIKDHQAILCLCYSMIYDKTGKGDCDYVHGEAPQQLDQYNSDF